VVCVAIEKEDSRRAARMQDKCTKNGESRADDSFRGCL
jgi:hypothetical protein